MPKDSLTAVIVSPDRAIHRKLETALRQGSLPEAVWVISDYPEVSALERLKEAQPGCVLFLDFSDPIRAQRIADELDRAYPFVSVVAIHNSPTKDDAIALMQLGAREVINSPIPHSEVALAFMRAAKKQKSANCAGGNIHAFLPAKLSTGTTTIATRTAAAVAHISKQRTLPLDFDLRLSVTSFLLQLDGCHSVQGALNEGVNLDDDLVRGRDGLDILASSPFDVASGPSADSYKAVLNCAQARYSAICVDMPGAMERHELEALGLAKESFFICTTDVTGLHMAKKKRRLCRSFRWVRRCRQLSTTLSGGLRCLG